MKTLAKKLPELENLSSILLSTLDETVFFPQLGKYLSKVFPVDRVVIYLVKDSSLVCSISKNGKYDRKGIVLAKGEGPSGHVIRTRRPYFCNNTQRDPLFATNEDGVRAELAMPVAHEGIVIATIHFQCIKSKYQFSHKDITRVMEILREIKTPLANMKMYLAAKNLNDLLLRKVEEKEQELQKEDQQASINSYYKIKKKEIISQSKAMKQILKIAGKVAVSDVNCLLVGGKGVGKEMIARHIHCHGPRHNKAFIGIDCSAFDEKELESKIFGEEIGTLKVEKIKHGLLEMADGGTLFLNNIDCSGPALQSKLNDFLNDKVAFRRGGDRPYRSNVRMMVASHLDLTTLSTQGKFREDLLFSLNTMILRIPSLVERLEDIETLATHFLNGGRPVEEQKFLSPGAVKLLNEYHWPSNVRELQSIIERAYILSDGKIIERKHLVDFTLPRKGESAEKKQESSFSKSTLDEVIKNHICMALEHFGGNKTKTAKTLGITVKTLYNKLYSYGMTESKKATQ